MITRTTSWVVTGIVIAIIAVLSIIGIAPQLANGYTPIVVNINDTVITLTTALISASFVGFVAFGVCVNRPYGDRLWNQGRLWLDHNSIVVSTFANSFAMVCGLTQYIVDHSIMLMYLEFASFVVGVIFFIIMVWCLVGLAIRFQ